MSRAPFQPFPLHLGGGLQLQTAPDFTPDGAAVVLSDFKIDGVGRITPRSPLRTASGAAGPVVGGARFPHGAAPSGAGVGALAVVYEAGSANLYRVNVEGQIDGGAVGTLWSGLAAQPRVVCAVLDRLAFFCVEDGSQGLRIYNPATGAITTPTFQFDADAGAPTTPKPRGVAVWRNFLFLLGWESETKPNSPQAVRFSYLGLQMDPNGSGDAGGDAASMNLFDREDAFDFDDRGQPVTAAVATDGGPLVIASLTHVETITGAGRPTQPGGFQMRPLVGGEVGVTNALALAAADGGVYAWGKNGPWRWRGAGSIDERFADSVRPLFSAVDPARVFVYHAQASQEVRYCYPSGSATRVLCWSYAREEWNEEVLSAPVYCAFEVASVSYDLDSSTPTPPGPPAGAPSGLVFGSITSTGARVVFTSGDSAAETRVYLDDQLLTTLDAGKAEYVFTGLSPAKSYSAALVHVKNQQTSAKAEGGFTTATVETKPAAPTNLQALDSPDFRKGTPGVFLSWSAGQTGVYTEVWRREGEGASVWINTLSGGETSMRDSDVVGLTTYAYKVRHVSPTNPSNVSDFTAEALVTPNAVGGMG